MTSLSLLFIFHQDCCLIPESPFYLEGKGGLLEYVEKRLKENGHMVIVVAEGAGQDIIAESIRTMHNEDASGNKLLLDVGLWLSQKIKVRFGQINLTRGRNVLPSTVTGLCFISVAFYAN